MQKKILKNGHFLKKETGSNTNVPAQRTKYVGTWIKNEKNCCLSKLNKNSQLTKISEDIKNVRRIEGFHISLPTKCFFTKLENAGNKNTKLQIRTIGRPVPVSSATL